MFVTEAGGDMIKEGVTRQTAIALLLLATMAGCGTSTGHPATAGLSLMESFPATAESDTLGENSALTDGNVSVSANVDLGYSAALSGDTNPRDVGVRFADPPAAVNTLYVWVDRQLPVEVSAAYSWAAYLSEDNLRWTAVSLVGPAAFSAVQNRFEIAISLTQARYVKVVTRPLSPGVSTDSRFANVFVTELQALLVTPAQAAIR
jgi:hypothetical protein